MYRVSHESKYQVVSIETKAAHRTRQWQCPQCANWDYESQGPRGGAAWHDCKACGYSEKQPTEMSMRHAPLDWDEDEQGAYDYDEWYDEAGNPHMPDQGHMAKFQVVALGEKQLPGGVGATQTTGPTDGEGYDHPDDTSDMADAGKNSFEQNVALETWVNFAVDMLNRGKQEEEVKAQLAHDGCPEPEAVLQRAVEQPMADPVGNEGASDPFEIPFQPQDDGQNMESVSQQPPVLANWRTAENNIFDIGGPTSPENHIFDVEEPSGEDQADLFDVDEPAETDNHVAPISFKDKVPVQEVKDVHKSNYVRIAGTSWKGFELDRWEDLWGQEMAKVALSEGGVITVAASQVEPDATREVEHPVIEIQSFIDGLDEVEPTRPSVVARIANLKVARVAVRQNISKVGFSDQIKLEGIDHRAEHEIRELQDWLKTAAEAGRGYGVSYRGPGHQINLYPEARTKVANEEFNQRIPEKAAIFLQELDPATRESEEATTYAAAHFASTQNGDIWAFVAEVQKIAYPSRPPYSDDPEIRGQEEDYDRNPFPVDMKRDDFIMDDDPNAPGRGAFDHLLPAHEGPIPPVDDQYPDHDLGDEEDSPYFGDPNMWDEATYERMEREHPEGPRREEY